MSVNGEKPVLAGLALLQTRLCHFACDFDVFITFYASVLSPETEEGHASTSKTLLCYKIP